MSQETVIKAKLGRNVFKLSKEPHINVNRDICRGCQARYCLFVCPTKAYSLDERGEIQLDLDGCLECGTCRIACLRNALEWDYPQGGFGVQFRFG